MNEKCNEKSAEKELGIGSILQLAEWLLGAIVAIVAIVAGVIWWTGGAPVYAQVACGASLALAGFWIAIKSPLMVIYRLVWSGNMPKWERMLSVVWHLSKGIFWTVLLYETYWFLVIGALVIPHDAAAIIYQRIYERASASVTLDAARGERRKCEWMTTAPVSWFLPEDVVAANEDAIEFLEKVAALQVELARMDNDADDPKIDSLERWAAGARLQLYGILSERAVTSVFQHEATGLWFACREKQQAYADRTLLGWLGMYDFIDRQAAAEHAAQSENGNAR